MHGLFEKYRLATGLTLKPSKCVAILVGTACTEENIHTLRNWLNINIPEWKHFKVETRGKYLGVYIGPELGGVNWEAPIAKATMRANDINASKPPLEWAARQYTTRVLPVLGYVGQLTPPLSHSRFSNLSWPTKS